MKKKNLNFLLALLAALALVFAGACSDGSDDDGSDGGSNSNNENNPNETPYTSDVSGLSFTYEGSSDTHESAATYLGPVTLAFDSTGYGVSMSVQYIVCTAANSDGCGDTSNYTAGTGGQSVGYNTTNTTTAATGCTLYQNVSVSGVTYSYTAATEDEESDTVTVTLPANDNNNSAATLTLTVTEDQDGAITGLAASIEETDSLSYTVKADGDTGSGCDLFSSEGTTGAIADATSFDVVSTP